jgi:hypothetical protein
MRKWLWVLAWCLLVVAIFAEMFSKGCYSSAVLATAHAAWAESSILLHLGNRLNNIGLALALAGLVSWVASIEKGKRGTPVIPLVLLIAYVVLSLVMV